MISHRVRNAVSTGALTFVGSLFVAKYSSEQSELYGMLAAGYAATFLAATIVMRHVRIPLSRAASNRLFIATYAMFVLASGVAIILLPEKTAVSRLAAMQEWIERFLGGLYPYNASTRPSGFPMLFILNAPFYIARNLGYGEVAGVLIFGLVLYHWPHSEDLWPRFSAVLLLPTFAYEVVVRSDLLLTMSLLLGALAIAERTLSRDCAGLSCYLVAAMFGLVLSTRAVTAVVLAAYVAFRLRQQHRTLLTFSAVTLSVFTLTIAPFAIWGGGLFFRSGPFSLQAQYLPLPIAVAVVLLACGAGWWASDLGEVIFSSGVLLFIAVACTFTIEAVEDGLLQAVFADGFDLGYFIFSVPLFILSLKSSPRRTLHRST